MRGRTHAHPFPVIAAANGIKPTAADRPPSPPVDVEASTELVLTRGPDLMHPRRLAGLLR